MDTILLKFVIISVLVLSLVSVPYKNISAESVVQNTLPELEDSSLKVETVYQGISFPSAMSFLGPNDILVLEKDQGTVKRIVNGVMIQEPLLDAAVSSKGERGMLGIAISKNPSNNNKGSFAGDVKYGNLYHFDPNNARNGLELTGSLKDKIANNSEERESVIFGRNFGGIVDLEISPDGYLYVLAIARLDELTASLNKDSGTGTVYRIVPSNIYNK
jgi:glucose/arabinose dehydrogenase